MDKENKFKVIDKDGKEIEFEVLFTFESDETHKNYMVYTDNSTDDDGNVRTTYGRTLIVGVAGSSPALCYIDIFLILYYN